MWLIFVNYREGRIFGETCCSLIFLSYVHPVFGGAMGLMVGKHAAHQPPTEEVCGHE